jgi:dTDP-4-dehydrorhamnose reductase
MLRLAQERERLTVIDDQHGAPTGADLIADVTAHAIRQAMANPTPALAGIYHLVASGETSWHGYASHVIEQARHLKPDAGPESERHRPCAHQRVSLPPLSRPLNSRLNTHSVATGLWAVLPRGSKASTACWPRSSELSWACGTILLNFVNLLDHPVSHHDRHHCCLHRCTA